VFRCAGGGVRLGSGLGCKLGGVLHQIDGYRCVSKAMSSASITATTMSMTTIISTTTTRSVLDTPMPVPLLDVPSNLERLLRTDASALRERLVSLVTLLGPEDALTALYNRPVEAALMDSARLRGRMLTAEAILGCGKVRGVVGVGVGL